jgi:hypothetical protein
MTDIEKLITLREKRVARRRFLEHDPWVAGDPWTTGLLEH